MNTRETCEGVFGSVWVNEDKYEARASVCGGWEDEGRGRGIVGRGRGIGQGEGERERVRARTRARED